MYLMLRKSRYRKVMSSDEAWFYFRGSKEKRSVQYIKTSETRADAGVNSHVEHPVGVMVWICFDVNGCFTPIFVDKGAKINSDYYIEKVLKPFAKEYNKKYPHKDMLFQQDSAPAHVSKKTIEFLEGTGIPYIKPCQWIHRSLDATPCDYWLWVYLKNRVNKRKVKNIRGLKPVIREEVKNIPVDMIERVMRSLLRRMRKIRYARGGHIEK